MKKKTFQLCVMLHEIFFYIQIRVFNCYIYSYKTSEAPCIKALIQMGFERRIGRQGRATGGTLSPGAQGAVAPAPTRAGGRSPRPMSPADGRSRPLSPSGAASGSMSMTKGAKEEEVTAMLRAEYRNVPESMLKNLIVKYAVFFCYILINTSFTLFHHNLRLNGRFWH